MRLRYLGGAIAPNNQPLSNANNAAGVAAQYQGSFSRQDVAQAETRGLWAADPDPVDQTTVMNINADNAANALQNNTFIDGAQNLPVTRTGSVTQGSFNPFAVPFFCWSNAFDGTGDYLDVTPVADLAVGNGSWTIEFYVNFSTLGTITWLYDPRPTGTNGLYPTIYKAANNTIRYFYSSADQIVGPAVAANTWYHIAVCCNAGTSTQLFVNGVNSSGILGTSANNFLNGASRPRIGASGVDASGPITGYISSLRVTKTVALYTSNFIPPTALSFNTVSSNVKLQTCNNYRFNDVSNNTQAITINGNPTVSTFSPFYTPYTYKNNTFGASLSFNGTNQYLSLADDNAWDFGSANFTVEGFFNTTATTTRAIVGQVSSTGNATTSSFCLYASVSGFPAFLFSLSGAGVYTTITTTVPTPTNVWVHLAAVRNGATVTLYMNGVSVGTASVSTTAINPSAASLGIGRSGDFNGEYFGGTLSNVRIVKGTAVYTANFTIPTQPLQAITNTQLLTCQGSAVDSSTNNFTITNNNAVTVSTSGPFTTYVNQPFRSWPAGSIFCDGTASYLNLNGSATLAFGSNDFTISMWAYFNGSLGAANQVLYDGRASGGTAALAPAIYVAQTTSVLSYFTNNAVRITGTTVIRTGQWYYIVVIRNAGNTSMYLNGVQEGSTYVDTNVYINGASRPTIGAGGDTAGAGPVNGFIYGVQVRNGTAGGFAIPTYPNFSPNTLPNTRLYLAGVNAGMYDTVGFTDYQTLGNAQVSTLNVKYGSGSMFFDGTGDWLISTATTNNANPLNLMFFQNDFTIEAWINVSSFAAVRSIISKGAAATGWAVEVSTAGKLTFAQTAVAAVAGNSTMRVGQWYHIAVVRSGSGADNIKMYVNGILDYVSAAAVTTNFNQTELIYIGASRTGTTPMLGYIADLRVTKSARYLTDFVPPRATLPKH